MRDEHEEAVQEEAALRHRRAERKGHRKPPLPAAAAPATSAPATTATPPTPRLMTVQESTDRGADGVAVVAVAVAQILEGVEGEGLDPGREAGVVRDEHRLVRVHSEHRSAALLQERQLQVHPHVQGTPEALLQRRARQAIGARP